MFFMKKTVTMCAPAKINLFLDVKELRGDGYHNIESVMQSISLCDKVTVTVDTDSSTGNITVTSLDSNVPANICSKAVRKFFEYCGEPVHDTDIYIEKSIPMQAGLGGGSSDAAAVIAALNNLLGVFLDSEELCNIASNVGSDVPFCIVGRTQYCTGKGDMLRPLPLLPDCKIVVAKGSGAVSTADAYKNIDSVPPLNNEKIASAFCSEDINAIAASCGNIFEKTVNLPEIGEIKGIMKECCALCSCMTGSGSAVFGIFTKNASAAGCADRLKAMGYFAAAADPVPYGVKRIDG